MQFPPSEPTICGYDAAINPFDAHVKSWLGWGDLLRLHETLKDQPRVVRRENDQNTALHARLYAMYDDVTSPFLLTWLNFIREWVVPLVGEEVVYQVRPTWRVQLPGNLSVGEFHRDRQYGHPDGLTNLWVPLCLARESRTIQIEGTHYDANLGQVLMFDGVNQLHGNVPNMTDLTRVSFDARVMPASQFKDRPDLKSINTGARFVLGGYYARSDA